MPKYINDDSDDEYKSEVPINLTDNQIIIYLNCNCAIISPVDEDTNLKSTYYCDHCKYYKSVIATVRHLCRR